MLHLKIIIASTRPGRKGPAIAEWFYEIAKQHADFSTEIVDLAKINLPFLDEPVHPMMQKYHHQHTKDWSTLINGTDAFVIVMPEYNYGFTAPLKNALDYLYKEWNYKPVAFISYGGVSGGLRAVQMLKQVVTTQKMMPLPEGVPIPFFAKFIDESGKFNGDEALIKSSNDMLKELHKWAVGLKGMRS